MTGSNQKLSSLQILRGLAAVWVVLFHLEFLAAHYFHASLGIRLVDAGHLGVHLFFVLSGFIIYWIHDQDMGNANAIRSYFLKRITRIYPLLIALNTIKLVYMAVSGYGVRAGKFDLSSILGSFLLLPTTSNFLIDVTWSLAYEMWFYLVFGVLLLLGRKWLYQLGIGYGLLIVALNLPGVPRLEGMAHFIFNPLILEFMLGCVIAVSLRRQTGAKALAGFVWLGLGLTGIVIGLFGRLDEKLASLPDCVWWGMGFGMLLLGCLLLERTFDFSRRRSWILLGDASYSIYLAHSLTLNVLAIGSQRFLPAPSGSMLLLVLLGCGALGVVSGVVCYFWIEYPLHKYFRDRIQKGRGRRMDVVAVPPSGETMFAPSGKRQAGYDRTL